MGDIVKKCDIFKKLGSDSSNQWIFCDERLQGFFEFFALNITEDNLLTENEVLEWNELCSKEQQLSGNDLQQKLLEIEAEYPGLLSINEGQIEDLKKKIEILEREEKEYKLLEEEAIYTRNRINQAINELDNGLSLISAQSQEMLSECQKKAKQLEDLQMENFKLGQESEKCYTKIHSPPLFLHQMPLDQYFVKCDTFLQYFSLYMKENFKIQDFLDLEDSEAESLDKVRKLESLGKSMESYSLAYLKERALAKATEYLIDQLDLSKIHAVTMSDLQRETHELELLNTHHLKDAYDTVLNDLTLHVQESIKQRLELVLYENTKQKLDRALKRHEEDKNLHRIISGVLTNAEILWIGLQLDLEKARERYDPSQDLLKEGHACWRRIKEMRHLASACGAPDTTALFIGALANDVSQYLGTAQGAQRLETKSCLYEYEKFCRLLAYALQNLLNKKSYGAVMEAARQIQNVEYVLNPLIYGGPTDTPLFENTQDLTRIFNARAQQQHNEKALRKLRMEFQENIRERMERDSLWRSSQLLWVWFLTDPQRMLMAIEEVKKVTSKIPSMGIGSGGIGGAGAGSAGMGMKHLGGIRRM